jgi:hypothetical protein
MLNVVLFWSVLSPLKGLSVVDFMPSGIATDLQGNILINPSFKGNWAGIKSWSIGTGGGEDWLPPENINDPWWGGSPGEVGDGSGSMPDDPDCTYCDGSKDKDALLADNQSLLTGGGYRFLPIVYPDIDGYTYIVNLSDGKMIKALGPDEIPVSDKGFKVIKMRRTGLTIGLIGSTFLVGFGAVSANLILNANGNLGWVSETHVRTYEEIDDLPFMNHIPTTRENVEALAKGDSITFQADGTIGIHVGLGVGPMMTGVEANITGSWITNIRKTGKDKIAVSYTRGNVKNVDIMVGTIGLQKAKAWYKGLRETQAYEFDLSRPDGMTLYKRMLKGDVATVKKYYLKQLSMYKWKKFAKENKLDEVSKREMLLRLSVKKWKASIKNNKDIITDDEKELLDIFFTKLTVKMIRIGTRQTTGTAVRSFFSIPLLLKYNWTSNGRDVVVVKSREIADGMIGTSYLGVSKKIKTTSGGLSSHSNQSKVFVGGIQEVIQLNPGGPPVRAVRIFGQLKYEYHRKKWREKKWDEKIKQAAARIGFKKELMSIVRPYNDKVAFAQHSADLLLSQETIIHWINWANGNDVNILKESARKMLVDWFNNLENKQIELCGRSIRRLCKRRKLKEIDEYTSQAYKALNELSKLIPTGKEGVHEYKKKYKQFAKQMTKFGEGFSKNHFILHAFLNIARVSNGDQFLVFQWQGSHFPRQQKVLIPSKKFIFTGHQVCGIMGQTELDDCQRPLVLTPM